MTPARVRKPGTPYVKAVRSMVPADIESLRQLSARTTLQKLSVIHETMVRMFALGATTGEVADALGYTPCRVSIIKNSPAFQERLARFSATADEATHRHIDRTVAMMAVGRDTTLSQMLDRVESGELSDAMLPKYFAAFADRTNYHPKTQTNININANFAARLELARARSREIRTIEPES